MKNALTFSLTLMIIFAMAFLFSGCEFIGDIFGAGVYTGIFIVVFVIGLIIFLIARMMRKK